MAAKFDIVKGQDGALYLVATVDGVTHAFASVNASQVAANAIEQGKAEAPQNAENPQLGAYTGPASDVTPSAHLTPAGASDEPEDSEES